MKTRHISHLVIAIVSVFYTSTANADTYRQLKANLRNCINTTKPATWARLWCVLDCYAAYVDQKVVINVNIGMSSTGFQDTNDVPNLRFNAGDLVTVDVDIISEDMLSSVDLILVDDRNNPADPEFGVILGTDTDGADGWSVTFDSTSFGEFSGFLVAQAHFVGHDEEIDGDQAVILAGTQDIGPPIPTVSQWGLIVMAALLVSAGTIVIVRRRRRIAA